MRAALDTFLSFLKDNLPSLTIHPVRRDPNDPNGEKIVTNAVNVQVLDATFHNLVPELALSVDVVHEDELTAYDWTEQVYDLLSTRFFTEKYDYTTPATPVRLDGVISWPQRLRFRPIYSPFYFHYHCRVPITGVVDRQYP